VKSEPKPKTKTAAALPLKPVAEELAFLRKAFKELIAAYTANIEGDIARLQSALSEGATAKKRFPESRVAELRDMLMLLRNFDVKPAKGRRRDLKKVESLVEELQAIAEHWE
jgi:hypothetical protein